MQCAGHSAGPECSVPSLHFVRGPVRLDTAKTSYPDSPSEVHKNDRLLPAPRDRRATMTFRNHGRAQTQLAFARVTASAEKVPCVE